MNAEQTQNKAVTLLFNPFFYIAGAQALLLGVVAILLTSLIAYFGHAHFDGVIDTHVGAAAPLWLFFLEELIDWLSLTIVLWVCGKIISKTMFRAVDMIGTQALARWPAIFISILALPDAFRSFSSEFTAQLQQGDYNFNVPHLMIFLALTVAMIPFLVWMIRLMYKSFSVVCNVSGGKAIGTFVIGLIVAEIISKACIVPLASAAISQPTTTHNADATDAATNIVGQPSQKDSSPADLKQAGGEFVEMLHDGKYSEAVAQFSPKMKSAMSEQQLKGVWDDLTKQAGPFQKQLGTKLQSQPPFKSALVTCQFEKKAVGIRVVYDSQQRVSGLWLVEPDPALVTK